MSIAPTVNPTATRVVKRGRRRARQFNAKVIDLTGEEWQTILEALDYRCAYCGEKPDRLTQDHIIPLCKGGYHTKSNVLPACEKCNNEKADKYYAEFVRERNKGKLPGELDVPKHVINNNSDRNSRRSSRGTDNSRRDDPKKLKRL